MYPFLFKTLLVVEDHGIILSLLTVVLAFFSSKLILEVVCCQPELQHVDSFLLFHVLQTAGQTRAFEFPRASLFHLPHTHRLARLPPDALSITRNEGQ